MVEVLSFIADKNTKGVIIGSMPGEVSLEAGEYYAHPTNLLWRFVFEAFGEKVDGKSYQEKINFLLAHNLGLWNALETCERFEGNPKRGLPKGIMNLKPNRFMELFGKYPNIRCLLFNGRKAHDLFVRYNPTMRMGREIYLLPSTSLIHSKLSVAERKKVWLPTIRLGACVDEI